MAISIIGFFVGIGLLVYMIIKGVNMIIASVITCIILLATAGTGFWDGLLGTYAGGAGGHYSSWFFLMLLGGIFGILVQLTGMATKIAKVVTGILRGNWMVLGIMIVAWGICMLGINGYISAFVTFPIFNALLRERRMDRQMLPLLLLAGGAIANGFPYGLDPVNVMPATLMGTSLGVIPVLGIIFTLIHTTMTCLYFNYAQGKAMSNRGEIAIMQEYEEIQADVVPDDQLPGFALSLIPFIVAFACVVITQRAFGIPSANAIVISLTLGIALVLVFQFKRLKDGLKDHLSNGAVSGLTTLIIITTLVGLTRVIVANPVYQIGVNFVLGLDMPMYLTTFFGTSIMTALTGSALTGPTLFLESFAEQFIANGADPGVLHRLTTLSAMAFNKLPNAAIAVSVIAICKAKFGPAYKHILAGSVFPGFVAGLVCALLATMGFTF